MGSARRASSVISYLGYHNVLKYQMSKLRDVLRCLSLGGLSAISLSSVGYRATGRPEHCLGPASRRPGGQGSESRAVISQVLLFNVFVFTS